MDQNCYTENDLVVGLKQGSDEAFTIIYTKYWKSLYFLAHKHLKSAIASEEIVQDVFLALWHYREKQQIQTLPLYLAAMTRYCVYRYLAREKKRGAMGISDTQAFLFKSDEALIDHKLLLEIIQKLSNQLPEKCRLVFTYNKLMDCPLDQVAAQMNISVKTAEAHLTKALKIIRGSLKDAFLLFPYL